MVAKNLFLISISLFATIFLITFILIVVPELYVNPNLIAGFAAGFVNPFAIGYSTDVIMSWFILASWVIYESKIVKYGWICLLLGIIPGVAVGFAAYLTLRVKQLSPPARH